ncbi:MAG: alpha/beta fold hydrolase [Leptolyngbyaceae cyanobacterium]
MGCIIAYHGWGLDQHCWADWQEYFQTKQYSFKCFDRGYFGPSHTPQFSGDRPYILLLHSFGLHLCPVATIAASDIVVIFNSFLDFHPIDPRLQRRSRLTLRLMGDRFRTHPHEVLPTFWHNCDLPQTKQPKGLVHTNHWVDANYPLLQQDLTRLGEVDLTQQSPKIEALRHLDTVWVIHGEGDRIVPMAQGATLASAVATSRWVSIPEAGHALPFSHPDQCWALPTFTVL